MSAVAERGPRLIVTPQQSLDTVAHLVGADLATRLAPAIRTIGHGIAILATSDALLHPSGPRYVNRIEEGLLRVVETVTNLTNPQAPPTGEHVSCLPEPSIGVALGENAADFIDDVGHGIHSPNTQIRGFAQLAARTTPDDPRAIQAADLIIEGADMVEEEAGRFRSPHHVSPPKEGEPSKRQPYIERVVAERKDGKIFVDIVVEERDLLPQPLILLPSSPAATVFEVVSVESVA